MVCTAYCCEQRECPAGYGCRPVADGSGVPNQSLDMCAPLAASAGMLRKGAICAIGSDCRSGVCVGNRCQESCCTDTSCGAGEHCDVRGAGVTACAPGQVASDLGALGCQTPVTSPSRACNSRMCFAHYLPDVACSLASDCPAGDNNYCGDFDQQADANDCVYDYCVAHCCTTSDCQGSVTGERFYCSKRTFNFAGDMNICLHTLSTGTKTEGQACASAAECLSNYCSGNPGLCRERCCTNADCQSPGAPRCGLESHLVEGLSRLVNVCLP